MSKLVLPMIEMPGVIRESVRAVLAARGFVIASVDMHGHASELSERQVNELLRELGNNTTQALYSLDESLTDSAPPVTPPAQAGGANDERDGASAVPQAAAPSRSSCTPSIADLLAVGETLRALGAAGRPNPGTAEALARVGDWLSDVARRELAKGVKAA